MKTVLIASNNAHKAVEIAEALDFPGWEFKPSSRPAFSPIRSRMPKRFWVTPASKPMQRSKQAAVWRCSRMIPV